MRLGQDRHLDAPYKYGPIIARRTLVLILIKPAKPKLDDHDQNALPQIRWKTTYLREDLTMTQPIDARKRSPIYRG